MLNFCTLFNSNYLTRGLAMYRSLEAKCTNFHLYIFAFDDKASEILSALHLDKATVISLKEFEDEELLEVKKKRTAQEYCWTCTPSTIVYCLKKYSLEHCTYIDADLLFFSDPQGLIEEMGEKSVLITEHRYTPKWDQTKTSGKYCVQFLTVKNDERGWKVLNWWRDACMEWCYNLFEEDRFGDQKYLDKWTTMFEGVHELQHLGGGVAPWNVEQYSFKKQNGKLTGTEVSTGKSFDVVFYHFHDFSRTVNNIYKAATLYRFTKNVIRSVYRPYLDALKKAEKEIEGVTDWRPKVVESEVQWIWKSFRKTFLVFIRGRYKNHYHHSYFYRVWPV